MLRISIKWLLLIYCSYCVVSFFPQRATTEQSPPPPQEQKRPEPKEQPREKATPSPADRTEKPTSQQQERNQEKPLPSEKKQLPAPAKGFGEKLAQPQAAGQSTPAAQPTPSPTVEPIPTTQPSPIARPLPTTEETPAPSGAAVESTRQPSSPENIASPSPVPVLPALDAELTQWSFRREMEALVQTFSPGKIFLSLLILLLGYAANRIATLLVARAGAGRNRYAEWLRRITPFISFGLWFVVILVIVQIFTHSLLALVLLITVAALALAIASQPLLRDLVGGLVILLERPFRLGDRVTVGIHRGEVREIGLRAFQLISPDDDALISVPNAMILGQSVVNAGPGTAESQVIMEFLLPEGSDLERAKRIACEAAMVSPYASIHKPIEVYFDRQNQNDLHTRIIVKAYVFDAQYERQLRSDTVERARQGFQSLHPIAGNAQEHPD